MQKLFYVAVAVAAIAAQAVPRPAIATPITYDLIGATATFSAPFGPSGTETLTGSFTFDPSAPLGTALSSVNINLSGPIVTDSFTMPGAALGTATILSGNASSTGSMIDSFLNNLGTSSDPLFSVHLNVAAGSFTSTSVTGSAVPELAVTPIPPAVALFGTALALFSFVLYRRKPRTGMSFSSVQRFA